MIVSHGLRDATLLVQSSHSAAHAQKEGEGSHMGTSHAALIAALIDYSGQHQASCHTHTHTFQTMRGISAPGLTLCIRVTSTAHTHGLARTNAPQVVGGEVQVTVLAGLL